MADRYSKLVNMVTFSLVSKSEPARENPFAGSMVLPLADNSHLI
jgi:hypothetical protein